MGFKSAAAPVTDTQPAQEQDPEGQAAVDQEAAYPAPQPPDAPSTDISSLLSMSDKELRISFAGILQACIVSQPLYAAYNILDRDSWRQAVKDEAEYWIRYALNRARKE